MEILGLIPARGGSKGIPHKNITTLAGRPLLEYTCKAALNSRQLTRVLLSTDNPIIADTAERCGVEVPFSRPADLAKDDTPMLDVIHHALEFLQRTEGYVPDVVVLLQPTSPLRQSEHIDAAVEILLRTGADSVVSVVEVPHHLNPVSLMLIEKGSLVSFSEGPLVSRRQDKPETYARNGPAVVATRCDVLLKKNSLFGDDSRPLVMAPEDSVDIDSYFDLRFAEFLLADQSSRDNNRRNDGDSEKTTIT